MPQQTQHSPVQLRSNLCKQCHKLSDPGMHWAGAGNHLPSWAGGGFGRPSCFRVLAHMASSASGAARHLPASHICHAGAGVSQPPVPAGGQCWPTRQLQHCRFLPRRMASGQRWPPQQLQHCRLLPQCKASRKRGRQQLQPRRRGAQQRQQGCIPAQHTACCTQPGRQL